MLLFKILLYVSYFAILFGLLVVYPLYRQIHDDSTNKGQTKPV